MFWDAFFNDNIATEEMGNVIKSATFIKSVVGIAVGVVLGFLAATKFAAARDTAENAKKPSKE